MDTVKTIIYSACIIGVISTMIDIASPEGSLKKQTDIIIGLVLVMVVITPLMDSDFKFRVKDFTGSWDKQVYRDMKDYENEVVLESADKELTAYFEHKFRENGIKFDKVIITLRVNEYNQIEITKVQVGSEEKYKSRITELIKSELPHTEISVIEGESN